MKRQLIFAVAAVLLLGAGCQRVQVSHDSFPQPHVGSQASFQEYLHWQVSGRVTVVDARTLRVEDFTFHGDQLPAYLMLLKDRKNVGIVKELTNAQLDSVTFDVTLPDQVEVEDFNLVSIFSPDIGAPVSSAKFSQ